MKTIKLLFVLFLLISGCSKEEIKSTNPNVYSVILNYTGYKIDQIYINNNPDAFHKGNLISTAKIDFSDNENILKSFNPEYILGEYRNEIDPLEYITDKNELSVNILITDVENVTDVTGSILIKKNNLIVLDRKFTTSTFEKIEINYKFN